MFLGDKKGGTIANFRNRSLQTVIFIYFGPYYYLSKYFTLFFNILCLYSAELTVILSRKVCFKMFCQMRVPST